MKILDVHSALAPFHWFPHGLEVVATALNSLIPKGQSHFRSGSFAYSHFVCLFVFGVYLFHVCLKPLALYPFHVPVFTDKDVYGIFGSYFDSLSKYQEKNRGKKKKENHSRVL